MNQAKAATVMALTAEVRVLIVGSRQITMSVFNQLDIVAYTECDPMGRVNPKGEGRWIVGRHTGGGVLVRALFASAWPRDPRLSAFEREQLLDLRRAKNDCNLKARYRGIEQLEELENIWRLETAERIAAYDQGLSDYRSLDLVVLAGLR